MSNAHFTTHHVLTSMSKLNWCSLSFENEENRKDFILKHLDHILCPVHYKKDNFFWKYWPLIVLFENSSNRFFIIFIVSSRFLNIILVIPFMIAADDHFLYNRVAGGLWKSPAAVSYFWTQNRSTGNIRNTCLIIVA